jgi:hypothetical protein
MVSHITGKTSFKWMANINFFSNLLLDMNIENILEK